MKLVNVRLSDEDAAKVADLQREGIPLSTVVREAVRARHLALRPRLRPSDVAEALAAIYERHPLGASDERIAIDSSDRRAVQKLVRRKLARRAPR